MTMCQSMLYVPPAGINTCENNLCAHFCLLSAVGSDGQSCMCRSGFILNEDQFSCSGMYLKLPALYIKPLDYTRFCHTIFSTLLLLLFSEDPNPTVEPTSNGENAL